MAARHPHPTRESALRPSTKLSYRSHRSDGAVMHRIVSAFGAMALAAGGSAHATQPPKARTLAGPPVAAATAGTGQRTASVNFPGDSVTEVRSPSGVTVYYVDPGADADGIDERPIMLRYSTGRTEKIDTFTRNADVSWSPHGDYLVVTDWIGSNVADCLAVTPSPSGARKRSMTSVVVSRGFRNISRDIRGGLHVYVSCGRWVSPSRVQVEVEGNENCDPGSSGCPPREFDHFLIYDFRSGRLDLSKRLAQKQSG